MTERMSYALWVVSPAGQAAQEQLDKLEREVASLKSNEPIKLRRNRRRGAQTTKVRPDRDQRAWVAWCKRSPGDRRWRVYHRCHFTGKMGEPIKCGRGWHGQALAEITVRIMQARGLQTAREIEALIS